LPNNPIHVETTGNRREMTAAVAETPAPRRPLRHPAPAAPDLDPDPDFEPRIEALLRAPQSGSSLPPDIFALYQAAIRRTAHRTVLRWAILAAIIDLGAGSFDYALFPKRLIPLDVLFHCLTSVSYLCGAALFHRPRFSPIQQAGIIIPCLLTVLAGGITGAMCGSPLLRDELLGYGVIIVLTGIMFFPIGIAYTTAMAVLAGLLIAGFTVAAPALPWAAKCQSLAVYAGAMGSLIWGRHILNNRHIQLFLLNTREELRATRASRLNERLSSIAYTDPLTEIPNRRYFDEICASMSDATKNLFPLSICMIDIDHFKNLNDNLGHIQGDRCLRIIARAIRQHLRGTDILARYGGEEFVLLLPSTTAAAAREAAERICGAITSLNHPNPGSPFGRVTASFGIATAVAPPLVIQSLMEQADAALYRAKTAGRNRVAA
jgi:diguanylate cyclase (GGDEF)-like protein